MLAPTNAEYLYVRGLLHLDFEEFDSAIKDFQESIELRQYYQSIDPLHADPLIGRAKAYLEIGNQIQAEDDINEAIRILRLSLAMEDWKGLWEKIALDLDDAKKLLSEAQQN